METFLIDRLVRDYMVPQLLARCVVKYKNLTGDALIEALQMKIEEKLSVPEGTVADEKLVEKIADAREIVEALVNNGVTTIELTSCQKQINDISEKYALQLKEVMDMKSRKSIQWGTFDKGYYIEEITVSPEISEVYDVLVAENYPIK